MGGAILAKLASGFMSLAKIMVPIPLMVIVAVAAWAHFDKASAVRHAVDRAVEKLVYSAENEALKAKLVEEQRLRQAGEYAVAGLQRAIAESDARQAAEDAKREQEIADYEQQLAASGRTCLLDDGDLKWLQQP